ncbi:MAG TPA: hypothetical protein VNL72_03535 [Gammaproteobacteria bacterium]|nr:hypothetical protein [Gammaproteobacteria bacterium]
MMLTSSHNLAPGDMVLGWADLLVEIQRVIPFGGKTLDEGVRLQFCRIVKCPSAAKEFSALIKVRGQQHTFDGYADNVSEVAVQSALRSFLLEAGTGALGGLNPRYRGLEARQHAAQRARNVLVREAERAAAKECKHTLFEGGQK